VKLCCSSPMVPGHTLTEKAQNLRLWGFDAIAVFQPYSEWSDDLRDELESLEKRTGVRAAEFVFMDASYGNAMSADGEPRNRCRAMYRQAAAICGEIGAMTEIEYQYGPQDPMPLFDPYQQLSKDQEDDFAAFYRQVLDLVTGTPARVLLEPINRYESRYLNRIADNIRIIDAVAHPNAGLLPDTFHMSIEEADMGQALIQAGDRIAHVHLGDSNRLLPGCGLLNWHDIFGALAAVEYDGYVNLECSTTGDPAVTLPATAAFLRDLVQS
jgi:sugar phosphate isomerase/epimerase